MIAIGGKSPPGLIASTGLKSSSAPKVGFAFKSVRHGGCAISLKSWGTLRIKAIDGSRMVTVNGKVDDLNDNDDSTNGHAGNSEFWIVL